MRKLAGSAAGFVFAVAITGSAWADCSYNEAEGLNAKITARGITLDATSGGWSSEKKEQLENIKSQLRIVSDQHNEAVTAHDQEALDKVCDDYRVILADIDALENQAD